MQYPESDHFEQHRKFLNKYYGWVHRVYDLTRKNYLLGRDKSLDLLLKKEWRYFCEIGAGTGRNLKYLHRSRPEAYYYGVDASDVMVKVARRNCPFATLVQGFAEKFDYRQYQSDGFDCILFSYCLSMFLKPEEALAKTYEGLKPGGVIAICDFASFEGIPRGLKNSFRRFLSRFHVNPLNEDLLKPYSNVEIQYGPFKYYLIATIRK